jgi:integrase
MKVTYIERSPGTWRLRIETGVAPDGRRLFKYETLRGTIDDVRRRRFAILNEHEEGTFAEPTKVTFGAFFKQWNETRLALKKITRSTAENYNNILRIYLGTIAGKRLQRITAQDIQAIYTAMARRGDLSMTTLHHVHAIVGATFRAARRVKIIKVNVMEEIEAPQKERVQPRSLTETQSAKLLVSLVGSWMEPIVALGLATGLRRGEVLGLRWGDVDLDGGRLHVRGQLVQYRDASVAWVLTKTEAGTRTISLAADAVNMLRNLRVAAGELRMKLGVGGKLDDGYVFSTDGGATPYRPARLGAAFGAHCEAHGFAGVTFHSLRHTHITTLLQRVGKGGAKAVSRRAGHADLRTTLEVYQTVFEEDDRALADLSSGLIGGWK